MQRQSLTFQHFTVAARYFLFIWSLFETCPLQTQPRYSFTAHFDSAVLSKKKRKFISRLQKIHILDHDQNMAANIFRYWRGKILNRNCMEPWVTFVLVCRCFKFQNKSPAVPIQEENVAKLFHCEFWKHIFGQWNLTRQHGSETITKLNLWPTNIIPVGVRYVLDQTEWKILHKCDSATMFSPLFAKSLNLDYVCIQINCWYCWILLFASYCYLNNLTLCC